MEVYLDNSATTQCAAPVADLVLRLMTEEFGNPSSLHKKGSDAEGYVREAAQRIARILRCKEKEIVFTSGGTESNNLALLGAAYANRRSGNRIITTVIEHPSVKKVCYHLKDEGFDVVFLPCDASGVIDRNALEEALNEETILVSVMMVNNEIGTIEPIAEISQKIKEKAPQALFHVDAIQAFGKLPIHVRSLGIDLLSVSAHKIHGPKGVGFLYIRSGAKVRPIIYGGGQQQDMRSGTINASGIAGLGLAAELAYDGLEEKIGHMRRLRTDFMEKLRSIDGVVVHSPQEGAAHIVNASVAGVRSEVMLHALEERGIYVSSGSACASNHPKDNSTLKNLGIPNELADSALRFSFSYDTNEQELQYTFESIQELAPVLRRFQRR